MRFGTRSGSAYEIRTDEDGGRSVRRLNHSAEKRADGEWVRLYNHWDIRVGESAVLMMESLSEYGEDDYGTPPDRSGGYTTRTTSTVTWIEEV